MDVVLSIFSCSGNICSRIPLSIACSMIWNRAYLHFDQYKNIIVEFMDSYFATKLFTKKSVIGSMTVEANVSPTAPPSRSPVPCHILLVFSLTIKVAPQTSSSGPPITENVANRAASR